MKVERPKPPPKETPPPSKDLRLEDLPLPEIEVKKPTKARTLCVGTILVSGDELNQQWLDLQLRYLKATTEDFDHVTYVSSGIYPQEILDMDTHCLTESGRNPKKNSQAHIFGLETLREFFVKNIGRYKHFLFLDMDAFPIKKGWQNILNPRLDKRHEVATLIRPENLELRAHCSVLYTRADCLSKMNWKVAAIGNDLIGNKESDVKLINYQEKWRDKVFVMVRSNKVNIHPLLCGVYYDMFYHHGCGSGRNYNMRSRPYWQHVVDKRTDVMSTIHQLMSRPSEFISELAGWCPDQYPRV
jgi:hypothetical protein